MTTEQLIAALLANLEDEWQGIKKCGGTIEDRRIARHYISQSMELVRRARNARDEVMTETGFEL
jgi:hypothetical protein